MKTEKLKKLPPDVLIYVQKVRIHLTTNETTKTYFHIDENEDEFFNGLTEIAKKNFDETGDPELSMVQFEELKKKVSKTPDLYGVFISVGQFGHVSLN